MDTICSYNHDVNSLINYPDLKLLDVFTICLLYFLLTKMITANTSINIIHIIVITVATVIDVIIARPIIKPVLELPLVDDVDAKNRRIL